MENLLIGIAIGIAVGIFVEWKYGGKGAALNASIHAKLDEIKASGLVARLIAKHGARGVNVAP